MAQTKTNRKRIEIYSKRPHEPGIIIKKVYLKAGLSEEDIERLRIKWLNKIRQARPNSKIYAEICGMD